MLHNNINRENTGTTQYFVQNPNQKQQIENLKKREHNDTENDPYEHLNISDKDGLLLDKHDSFYHTTKSLLVLFQLAGVMPIMRVPPETETKYRTTFKWISSANLWAYFIWGMECILVYSVGKSRITNFLNNSDGKFDEVIYNVIFISILIPHFLLPVAAWRHGPQVAIFKNMWTHYQLRYLRVTGTPIVFPNLYSLTWALCFFSWIVAAVVILIQFYLQPDFEFWHTFAYYPILAMFNGFCSLWFINCTAFGTASQGLAANLKKTLEVEQSAAKLAEYRKLWVDLSFMMQQLGRAYSNMYGIFCLLIFFTTIISMYGSFSEILENGFSYKELGLFVLSAYCMSLLFIICNEAYHASKKVGLDFQERLLNVNLSSVDHSMQKEIEMFLVAIAKNPPIMNLDGYTNINRELITTNVSFLVTYLVVLMQFKLTLLRQAATNKAQPTILTNITQTQN